MKSKLTELKSMIGQEKRTVPVRKYETIDMFIESFYNKFDAERSKKVSLHAAYSFTNNSIESDVNRWFILMDKGVIEINRSSDVPVDLKVQADEKEYLEMINNGGNPMTLMLRNKLRLIKGSPLLMLKFINCFNRFFE